MTLRDRKFERSTRRRVRRKLRNSKPLWSDYRQLRKKMRRNIRTRVWMGRLFFTFMVGFMLVMRPGSIHSLIAVIVLWELGHVFLRASQLLGGLHYSPALNVLHSLPISDKDIFRVQWRYFLQTSLWSLLDFTFLYSVLAFRTGGGAFSVVVGLAMAAVQWIFIVALAVCLLMIRWRRVFNLLIVLFQGSAIGLLFYLPGDSALTLQISSFGYWLPPVGWLVYAMGIAQAAGFLHNFWPCMISGAVLALFPAAHRRLLKNYELNEDQVNRARRVLTAQQGGMPEYPEMSQTFAQPEPAVAAAVNRAEFYAGLDLERLPLPERLVVRPLTCRERVLADFLFAGNPKMLGIRSIIFVLSIYMIAGHFLKLRVGSDFNPLLMVAGVYSVVLFAQRWRGFVLPRGAGPQSPFYALYPIRYWDLVPLILKVNLVRFLIWLPFIVGAELLLTFIANAPASAPAMACLKILLLALIAQPLLVIAQISPGTNDGQEVAIAFSALILFFVLLGGALAIVSASSLRTILAAGSITFALSAIALLVYGRWFNNNRFDLLPSKP